MAGADDLRPLDAAIDEIRLLHEAAGTRRRADRRRVTPAHRQRVRDRRAEPRTSPRPSSNGPRRSARNCERLDALHSPLWGRARRDHRQRRRSGPTGSLAGRRAVAGPDAAPISPEPYPVPRRPSRRATPSRRIPSSRRRRPRRRHGPSRRRMHPGGASGAAGAPRRPAAGSSAPAAPRLLGGGDRPARQARGSELARQEPVPEGVRLVATQMAIAGSSRLEIERRLQRQFGIEDAEPALDEIFGYDSSTPIE